MNKDRQKHFFVMPLPGFEPGTHGSLQISQLNAFQIELNKDISIVKYVKLWINHKKYRIILSCFKFKMFLSKDKWVINYKKM